MKGIFVVTLFILLLSSCSNTTDLDEHVQYASIEIDVEDDETQTENLIQVNENSSTDNVNGDSELEDYVTDEIKNSDDEETLNDDVEESIELEQTIESESDNDWINNNPISRDAVGKGIYIHAEQVNIYADSLLSSEVIGIAQRSEQFDFLEIAIDEDGYIWYMIRSKNGEWGWLRFESDYNFEDLTYEEMVRLGIEYEDRTNSFVDIKEDEIIVVASILNVRDSILSDSEIIDTVDEFSVYKVLDKTYDSSGNKWYLIKTEDGNSGWIASWYCTDYESYNDKLHNGYKGEIDGFDISMWMTEEDVIDILGEPDFNNGVGGHVETRYGETSIYYQYALSNAPVYGGITFIRHTGDNGIFGIKKGMSVSDVIQTIGNPNYNTITDEEFRFPGPYGSTQGTLCFILNDYLLIVSFSEEDEIVYSISFGTKYYSTFIVG